MTYDPIPYARAEGAPVIENNRRGALIGFGVGSIIMGAIVGCGALGLVMALAMAFGLGGGGSMPMIPEVAVALLVYTAMATLFIWVGVDSIRCKRWVRPVVVAVGWITIASVLFGLAFIVVGMRDMSTLTGQPTQTTTTTMATGGGSTAVMVVTPMPPTAALGMMIGPVLLVLVIAGAYVWFYSTQAVRRTLEAYDPTPSWTERCPLPVFVACAALLLGALGTVATTYEAAVPFYGTYVTGWAAVALELAAAATMVAAMTLMYRTRPLGWWMAVGVVALGFASAAITLKRLGATEFYRHGHATAAELDWLAQSSVMSGNTPLIFTIAGGAASLGYLLAVRRYFTPVARH